MQGPKNHHLHINQSLGAYRAGSLPNVNQITTNNSSIDLQVSFNSNDYIYTVCLWVLLFLSCILIKLVYISSGVLVCRMVYNVNNLVVWILRVMESLYYFLTFIGEAWLSAFWSLTRGFSGNIFCSDSFKIKFFVLFLLFIS